MYKRLLTFNFQLSTRRKGFTLMEILIAASIFAGVMIMTTGVLAQSSSFRGKIRATRETSEDTKKIADMITRDVREANASIDVTAIPVGPVSKTFKSGIVLLNCKQASAKCTFINDGAPYNPPAGGYFSDPNPLNTLANTLVIAKKDGYIMYTQSGAFLYRKMYSFVSSIDAYAIYLNVITGVANIISSSSLDTTVYFAGYTPDTSNISNLQQPYVQFYIVSKTKNYDTLSPNARSKMEIRSSVTARNFAN